MNTRLDAWRIAGKLRERSRCRVKVGAVITDARGAVFAWGWNHPGPDGLGLCAERHALLRANPRRLIGATVHIRGFNGANESGSTPCRVCHHALTRAGVRRIEYTDPGTKRRTTRPLAAIEAASRRYVIRRLSADDTENDKRKAA
ncbi:MAG: hypothetical protein OXG35_16875 [Acidobacteria bacterium]|nr:hypothetical protein [Acidobacteriota bacterium]